MKGPGYRLLEIRRTWRCPACGRERKLLGDVTSLVCGCKPEGTFMAIVSERTVPPRPFQNVSDLEIRSSAFGIDDMPVLTPHPSSLPPERPNSRRSYSEPPTAPPAETRPQASAMTEEPTAPPPTVKPDAPTTPDVDEEWGEGIL